MMGYKLIELTECHSTQDELKNQIQDQGTSLPLAVMTKKQSCGKGRRGNEWIQFKDALALSFSYPPEKVITLTALKIGVLICHYFKEVHDTELRLKWPNDIIDMSGAKVGGIIIDVFSNDILVVGIGLNLFYDENMKNHDFGYSVNGILSKEETFNVNKFLQYFDSEKEFKVKDWLDLCCHLNSKITFKSDDTKFSDFFTGVGENGEAEFKEMPPQYSGSILLL